MATSIWEVGRELDRKIEPISCESTAHVLLDGLNHDAGRNGPVFIDIVRYEAESENTYYGDKPAVSKSIAVCPMIPVAPGDFLGTFPGALRFTKQEQVSTPDLEGPMSRSWLNCSKVTGKLRYVEVAEAGEKTNVCLVWKELMRLKR